VTSAPAHAAAADVIIIGGGHNGLVAAAYLARAGRRVVVLEATSTLGGAVASNQFFDGVPASLSRFSYLVSVLPQVIVDDLGLDLELRSRRIASYTPRPGGGLLVERQAGPATRESFQALTGGNEAYAAWCTFEEELRAFAEVIEPTLTRPLPRESELRSAIDADMWSSLVERPLGELLEQRFADDTVRGVLLTDALIGTFTDAHDDSLRQNRCFLYHVIGHGTGEWKVPVRGMGRVAQAMEDAARAAGAELRTGTRVVAVEPLPDGGAEVVLDDGTRLAAPYVLANCAPAVLDALLGERSVAPEGSQTKINIVVRRLPRFASGMDPETGFAGTLHLHQGYAQLQRAHDEARSGRIPDPMPVEVYCHTLTDASILEPDLAAAGFHTLTVFGLHTPARLFADDHDARREEACRAALRSLQEMLAEPLDDCLARDRQGRPCIEVMTPLDVEAAIGMPGGHIFHGDLQWPWLAGEAPATTPAERWGVGTAQPGILICGSGAVRGGAVSGLGGHNAAMAVLEG